jgi:hypothetical protein
VREDVLLSGLVRQLVPDRGRAGADVEPRAVAQVVARLRAESKVIIYGRPGRTIGVAE